MGWVQDLEIGSGEWGVGGMGCKWKEREGLVLGQPLYIED